MARAPRSRFPVRRPSVIPGRTRELRQEQARRRASARRPTSLTRRSRLSRYASRIRGPEMIDSTGGQKALEQLAHDLRIGLAGKVVAVERNLDPGRRRRTRARGPRAKRDRPKAACRRCRTGRAGERFAQGWNDIENGERRQATTSRRVRIQNAATRAANAQSARLIADDASVMPASGGAEPE